MARCEVKSGDVAVAPFEPLIWPLFQFMLLIDQPASVGFEPKDVP